MAISQTKALKPRKVPVQSRSAVTVDAIYDAAIQVLLTVGSKRTTTIRVAERAGVSVGTLYQYHANIQSLMASVIQRHVMDIVEIMTRVCEANHVQPISKMLRAYVDAYIDAKTTNVDVSRALYEVFSDLNCKSMLHEATEQGIRKVAVMLATAPDCILKDPVVAARMIVLAPIGPTQALLEMGAPAEMIAQTREQLFLLYRGYVGQLAQA